MSEHFFTVTLQVKVIDAEDNVLAPLRAVQRAAEAIQQRCWYGATVYDAQVIEREGPAVELLPCCATCGALGATYIDLGDNPACKRHGFSVI